METKLNINEKFEKLGIRIPEILLPKKCIKMTDWAVVACDQYTSQPAYWEKVAETVGDSPSTLKLILPEAYLEKTDTAQRIEIINSTMKEYLSENILESIGAGFVLVDRSTPETPSRKGLIAAIDLEMYDYSKGSGSMVRATEGTVIERLPPRIKIRENALLELPHIMVLIDDPDQSVIEPLADETYQLQKLYDFELMMDGGHIKGWHITQTRLLEQIASSLEKLADQEHFSQKYDIDRDCPLLLYAVGDGNHSLATAKACWEKIKKSLMPDMKLKHPARYALVELVNIHNAGIKFEPIHRVLYNVDTPSLFAAAEEYFKPYSKLEICYNKPEIRYNNGTDISTGNIITGGNKQIINFTSKNESGSLIIENPHCELTVGALQAFLDHYLKYHPDVKIDYIHGTDTALTLGKGNESIALLLPAMDKNSLFKAVINEGALPRKTFSMGEANEKRYYLECRKITI